jgi:hypothetical protein
VELAGRARGSLDSKDRVQALIYLFEGASMLGDGRKREAQNTFRRAAEWMADAKDTSLSYAGILSLRVANGYSWPLAGVRRLFSEAPEFVAYRQPLLRLADAYLSADPRAAHLALGELSLPLQR